MALKVLTIAAVIAVAQAGHLGPALGYATNYALPAINHVPIAPVAPIVPVAPVPAPVISTSYGYTTKALGRPSLGYHVQPAVHAVAAHRYSYGGHLGGVPLNLGHGYAPLPVRHGYGYSPLAYGNGCIGGFGCRGLPTYGGYAGNYLH